VEADDVGPGSRNQGCQSGEQLQWLGEDPGRSISPGPLQGESDPTIGAPFDPGLGQRRAKDVSGQPLDRRPVAGMSRQTGMQVERIPR
jgi:hypothetical protein